MVKTICDRTLEFLTSRCDFFIRKKSSGLGDHPVELNIFSFAVVDAFAAVVLHRPILAVQFGCFPLAFQLFRIQ